MEEKKPPENEDSKELLKISRLMKQDISSLSRDARFKISKIDCFLVDIKKSFKEHTETMKQILKVNQRIEETLENVLMAIRQNEYLQAWYPEQHGFPAMKVSGIHPAKLKSKRK